MNGFANTILSLILGWLRVLINNLWKLLSSPDGGSFYQFMSEHWLGLLIALLVGGFVVDRIVYFIRWRPDYVWASRRARKREERARKRGELPDEVAEETEEQQDAGEAPAYHTPAYSAPRRPVADVPLAAPMDATETRRAPIASAAFAPTTRVPAPASARQSGGFAPPVRAGVTSAPIAGTRAQPAGVFAPPARAANGGVASVSPSGAQGAAYQPPTRQGAAAQQPAARQPAPQPAAQPVMAHPTMARTLPIHQPAPSGGFDQPTAHYAPIAPVTASTARAHVTRPYQPPQNLEPVFDDDPLTWDGAEALMRPAGGELRHNPAKGMHNRFGSAMPEPVEYLRDMQAGFAPQLPPERIYQPDESYEQPVKPPIHPGLGSDAFRQSFGLNADGTSDQAAPQPFAPYGQTLGEAPQTKARANPLAAIAKRARTLVGVDDEDHKLTIHDLQPTVDMRSAFHEPVYPQPKNNQGGDS